MNATTLPPIEDVTDINFTLNKSTLTLFIHDGMNIVVSDYAQADSPEQFNDLRLAVINSSEDDLIKNVYEAVSKYDVTDKKAKVLETIQSHKFGDRFDVCSITDTVTYTHKGVTHTLNKTITNKMMEMVESPKAMEAMIRFTVKLYKNPSMASVTQMFPFLEAGGFPLAANGNFFALKNVQAVEKDDGTEALMDIYTRTIPNNPGDIVTQPRNTISDDPHTTCSSGLHVCNHTYLKHYRQGDATRSIVVEINPKDVVSIPVDYQNAKMRVCKYKVISQIDQEEIGNFIRAALMDTDGIFEYVFSEEHMSVDEAEDNFNGHMDGLNANEPEAPENAAYMAGYKAGQEQLAMEQETTAYFYEDEEEEDMGEYEPMANIDPSTYGEEDAVEENNKRKATFVDKWFFGVK